MSSQAVLCLFSEDHSSARFLKRFSISYNCIERILEFPNLKALHLSNLKIDDDACKLLALELFESSREVQRFSMGLCSTDVTTEVRSWIFSSNNACNHLTRFSLPLGLLNRANVLYWNLNALEALHYNAVNKDILPTRFYAWVRMMIHFLLRFLIIKAYYIFITFIYRSRKLSIDYLVYIIMYRSFTIISI